MKHLQKKMWFSGSGEETTFDELVIIIQKYINSGSKVFIGTDSFVSKCRINFATAICLYGETTNNRYFFTRDFENVNKFDALFTRIMEEVRRTVELADYLYTKKNIDSNNIEIHIDVSPFVNQNATSKFADILQGYVRGAGFNCKIKPDAWASQSVADRHSK